MLTRDQAKEIAQARIEYAADEAGCKLQILDEATLERPFGWVFFYQSAEFLITGDYLCQLAGNAPLIVDRHSGKVTVTGTARPVDEYIASYEASLLSGAA